MDKFMSHCMCAEENRRLSNVQHLGHRKRAPHTIVRRYRTCACAMQELQTAWQSTEKRIQTSLPLPLLIKHAFNMNTTRNDIFTFIGRILQMHFVGGGGGVQQLNHLPHELGARARAKCYWTTDYITSWISFMHGLTVCVHVSEPKLECIRLRAKQKINKCEAHSHTIPLFDFYIPLPPPPPLNSTSLQPNWFFSSIK